MRIAVTGAGGKLGRHVVARALLAGHDVVAVDLPTALGELQQSHFDATTLPQRGFAATVECRAADLTQFDEVRAALAGTDAVAHLGALIHPRYPEPAVHHTNVGGTHHVLVAAEEHGLGAVCLASSVNAIGGIFSATPRYDYLPIDEEHPGRRSPDAGPPSRSPRYGCTPSARTSPPPAGRPRTTGTPGSCGGGRPSTPRQRPACSPCTAARRGRPSTTSWPPGPAPTSRRRSWPGGGTRTCRCAGRCPGTRASGTPAGHSPTSAGTPRTSILRCRTGSGTPGKAADGDHRIPVHRRIGAIPRAR
jgi:hypothetical protein